MKAFTTHCFPQNQVFYQDGSATEHRPLRQLAAVLFFVATLTAGCALHGPLGPADGPGIADARAEPGALRGSRVHWGGRIARVENRADVSLVEVVEQPLSASGRPRQTDQSGGRFIALIDGFIDPVIYAVGKPISMVGTLLEPLDGKIGDYPYRFAQLRTERHQLWQERRPVRVIYRYEAWPWGLYPYPRWPYRRRY